MSEIITLEELKQHCIKTIEDCERIKRIPNIIIIDDRRSQEHKLILQLIEEHEQRQSTDAVSREAVLKSLCELGYGDEENGAEAEYMYALRRVADKVKALPPVTLERPKGEWIWKEYIKGGFAFYTGDDTETGEKRTIVCDERRKVKLNLCSICGKVGDDTWLKFCPNCGADMRREEQNT